ncbi:NTP transferase domain-containing protein [Haloechinothrix sp. LS1_15]|uniref:NTP transferase domain-containing protein n=1 Tax=Haloechinothrix sp. LS1_15 TaxID=2652248 RepID=UPI002944FC7D|nr:NTP transferase domain-containing protein [Haloechinothrix sp. LS1_15]MDV6012825.1 NTP transferase domain-containing protein [Haloechinothrix sp. LS1_15]
MTSVAGVVLAGGRSSRMGTAKASLEWHGSTLLRHVTGILGRVVDGPIVVVRAPGQRLPALPPIIAVHEDPEEGRGPMQGLAVGLAVAAKQAGTAFVCSTDLPFLHERFVRAVLRGFRTDPAAGWHTPPDVVLPHVHGFRQPLAAGYRTSLAGHVTKLLEAGRSRPAHLFEECRVRTLEDADFLADPELSATDPELDAVVNVNTPEEYRQARERAAPEVHVECFGVLATGGRTHTPTRIRAANLGSAAEQLGLELDRHIVAAVNGDQIRGDRLWPLQHGDTVSFLSADAGG